MPASSKRKAEAQVDGAPENVPKRPPPLSPSERFRAYLLIVLGVALAAVALFGFASDAEHFAFKSKEVVKTERQAGSGSAAAKQTSETAKKNHHNKQAKNKPKGHHRKLAKSGHGKQKAKHSAKKQAAASASEIHETEFADTVTIFALTFAAALILGGAFYGRLRTMKLGGLEMTLAGEEEKEEAKKAAEEKVQSQVSGDNAEVAKAAAGQLAIAELDRAVAQGLPPSEEMAQVIGEAAAKKLAAKID
jgi:hypothetical protein